MAFLSSSFWRGLRAILPLLPGIIPFSMVAGVAAVQVGFSPFQAVAFSVIGFAGSAQLIAAQMFGTGVPLALILLSALVVNLRFVMYSASLVPVFGAVPKATRWLLAYLLTDHVYAMTMARAEDEGDPVPYYLGMGGLTWLTWVVGTTVGALLGVGIPAQWPLEFAIPLSFLALLIPVLKTRPQLLAAAVSGGVAVATHDLPFRLNLMVGAACGILAGLYLQRARDRQRGVSA